MGNIGTYKSTWAEKHCDENTVIVNADSIFPMLSGGKYLYEEAKAPVYRAVDRTNLTRKIRAKYIAMGKAQDARIVCVDFGKKRG
jgi:predicted kinase